MSNFPKPDEIEELLESYSELLELFSKNFNPFFQNISLELKEKVDALKGRVEKYACYSKEEQLKHLTLSDHAIKEIDTLQLEMQKMESKINELEKMFRFGQNLL